jgi:predicted porin
LEYFYMKKTLVALAVLAASGASFAQATITGAVGIAFFKDTQSNIPATVTNRGIYTDTAYIDIDASEDLGSGMKAAAGFEINADGPRAAASYDGDRYISVSSSAFGIKLGSTRSGSNQSAALVAPAGLYEGIFYGNVYTRAAKDYANVSVPFGPVTGTLTYAEDAPDGAPLPNATSTTLGVKYSASGLMVNGQYTSTAYNVDPVVNPRKTSTDLTVTYDAGVAKFGIGYDSARRGKVDGNDNAATAISFSAPLGSLTVGVNYAKRDTNTLTQLGLSYDLSKRTNLNASFGSYKTAESTATVPSTLAPAGTGDLTSDEWRVMLTHSF